MHTGTSHTTATTTHHCRAYEYCSTFAITFVYAIPHPPILFLGLMYSILRAFGDKYVALSRARPFHTFSKQMHTWCGPDLTALGMLCAG